MKSTLKLTIADGMFAWSQKIARNLAVLGIALSTSIGSSYGQTLDDFEDASEKKGAGLIPFSDMRREANSLEGEVTQRHKESAGLGPDDLGKAKNKILKARKYSQANLKSNQASFDKHAAGSSSSFNPYEDDVEKYEKEIVQQNKDLVKINNKIDDGIEAQRRLWNARGGLRDHFKDVIYKLKSWKSDPRKCLGDVPSSSDVDATKKYKADVDLYKRYIDKCITGIEKGVTNHLKEENITKKAENTLKTIKGKTAPF